MSDVVARLNEALSGRYRIEGELGRGGMATVYLGRDLKHGRDVAVKVLRTEVADAIGEARFQREIGLVARLTHPHIVPLYDSGEADGLRFFVMPVIKGGSLAKLIDGPLPTDVVVAHVRAIASGLDYAHAQGVVHRDLKPSNLLLHEGEVLIADLGIAFERGHSADTRVTQVGSSLGTPAYMSPEHLDGSSDLDARSDVYALGCIAFEMLTGQQPFTAVSSAALTAKVLTEAPPAASSLVPRLAPRVDAVLRKALAKRPSERFGSAGEFGHALSEALAPTSGATGGRRITAAAAVVLATVIAGFFWQTGARRSREAALVALAGVDSLVEAGASAEAYFASRDLIHPVIIPELEALRRRFTADVTISTDPAGATVSVRPYASPDQPWIPLGTTPLEVPLPTEVIAFRIELDGYEPVEVNRDAYTMGVSGNEIPLLPVGSMPADMAHIPAGVIDLGEYQAGLWGVEPVELGAYFIDLYEVTNDEYAEFVAAGSYDDVRYWPPQMMLDGRAISAAEVAETFVDDTGRPGPSTWELGRPPEGKGNHPVTGVSWYEASAYARYVGKRLPTIYHWRRAVGAWSTNHITVRSNIAGSEMGTMPVGATEGRSEFGLADLAGNAREWVSTFDGQLPMVMGGGWNDPFHSFYDVNPQPAWDRSVSNGFRLMAEPQDTTGMAVWDAPVVVPRRDFTSEEPVSDTEFEGFRRLFAYDMVPLAPRIASIDTTDAWVREGITFETGFGSRRMKVYLYRPLDAGPEPQVVVYFPGSGVLRTTDPLEEIVWLGEDFNFLMATGRAVALPVFLGAMDRSDGFRYRMQDATHAYRDHVIAWGKELGRTLDYLETRDDIDTSSFGYYGFSWGARMGAIMLALHPRLTAAVLHSGGLSPIPVQPEADPFNYLSRVRQPVLMLNSKFDNVYPIETAVRPYFEGLGSAEKNLQETTGGHFIARNTLVRETLNWFDSYLGR